MKKREYRGVEELMTAAEATAHPTNRKTNETHKVFPSPLELYQHKFCRVCKSKEWCKPNELHMLICVLTAMLNTQLRTNQLNQQRGAHF